jgi:alanyl-tRNA synthetase
VWDTGLLISECGSVSVSVTNVQVFGGFVVHSGVVETGTVTEGLRMKCVVDYVRRQLVVPNHTITHVLNFALRKVLLGKGGDDDNKAAAEAEVDQEGKVDQKGSDVNAERLRFDFSWDEAITSEQLAETEAIVNHQIKQNYQVFDKVTPLEQAKEIFGLRAVFGETYPDPVRVVSVGVDVEELLLTPNKPQWKEYSIEFCGGTHLKQLGDAEQFVIVDETSTSAGVRRVTAVTRTAAAEATASGKQLLESVAAVESCVDLAEKAAQTKKLKQSFGGLSQGSYVSAVAKAQALVRLAALEKQSAEYNKKLLKEIEEKSLAQAKAWGAALEPKAVAAVRIDFGDNGKLNSALMKALGKVCKGGCFLLVSRDEANGKVCVYASCDKASSMDALKWCTAAVAAVAGEAGKVGGRDKNAMGSVPGGDAEACAVLKAAEEFAKA